MTLVHALRRDTAWRTLIVLALVAIVARLRTFGNPIVFIDEEFYFQVARAMWRGAVPYVDIWDRKPIGLFLVYLPAAPWSPQVGVYVYQAMATAAVIATSAVVVRTARAAGWTRGALVAGILYILWLDLADGNSGQSPVYYNLPVAMAAMLIATDQGSSRHGRRGLVAMLLLGIALQIKYSVLFEGVWMGAWLLWRRHRAGASVGAIVGYGMALASTALVPTLMVAAWYGARGQIEPFVFANFQSIFLRHPDPVAMQIDNAETALALLGPLVAMTLAGIGVARSDPRQRERRLFLYGWLIVAIAGFAAFGGWYNHYTLPVMLPACLCTAGFLGDRWLGRWLALPAIVLSFVAGQLILSSEIRHRGTPAQFAAVVRAVGTGPGALYGDMGNSAVYVFTGRPGLSRYIFPTHLQIAREAGAIGIDQASEINRIFAQRPEVVTLEGPQNGAAPDRVAQVEKLVQRDYRLQQTLPMGRGWVKVYRRAAPATSRP